MMKRDGVLLFLFSLYEVPFLILLLGLRESISLFENKLYLKKSNMYHQLKYKAIFTSFSKDKNGWSSHIYDILVPRRKNIFWNTDEQK